MNNFSMIQDIFLQRLDKANSKMHEMLKNQVSFIDELCNLQKHIRSLKGKRRKKIVKLRASLSDGGKFEKLLAFEELEHPLDPNIKITGLIPETAHIFKSAMQPFGLDLRSSSQLSNNRNGILFKFGDDTRQDQLIIQMINLMDRLLKKENMDLALTPYKVLAISNEIGIIEKVPNVRCVADILKDHGTIQKYLKKKNKSTNDLWGIKKSVMDNYVKSCAGYCVITYILGIGDRHLDNLLMTERGNLFHIDFGYILGADPKPLPPPFKLCKEMVEGMGGRKSQVYEKFKKLCCEAFNILRKSANLIINLFALMLDADLEGVKNDRETCLLKIQEKYRLDLSDEEAMEFFQELINESVTALFPQIVETIHKLVKKIKD